MEYISDLISPDEFPKWEKQNILLDFQTGKGKTSFILDVLSDYYQSRHKKILLLVNRIPLYRQLSEECENKNITLKTYQGIRLDTLSKFDVIICDEAHYFFLDSSFNDYIEPCFQEIISIKKTKIFISATPEILRTYFSDNSIPYLLYSDSTKRDYSFIDKLSFFKSYRSSDISAIQDILDKIPSGEKAVVFSESLDKLEKLYDIYKDRSEFICAAGNKHYKNEMKRTFASLEEDQKFESDILFTTIVLDNGISILDSSLKHIIIDVFDPISVIQCLGRKRITEGEKINLYMCDKYFMKSSKINSIDDHLDAVDFFEKHSLKDFVERYSLDFKRSFDCFYLQYCSNDSIRFLIKDSVRYYYSYLLRFCNSLEYENSYTDYFKTLFNRQLNNYDIIRSELLNLLDEYKYREILGNDKDVFTSKLFEIVNRSDPKLPLNKQPKAIQSNLLDKLNIPFTISSQKINTKEYRNKLCWMVKPK